MRPGLKDVLRELKKHFELILFTSSTKTYCEALIKNVIENEEEFFDYKLYK
ncbi:MAG: NIF family HAD-type phosphatase [Candidatus Roizmanbacteria bacterium]